MKLVTRMTATLVVAALAASVGVASAFAPRAPQVVFAYGPLQGFLAANDGCINVATDQLDAQAFTTGITGNADFTLTLKTGGGTSTGVYNALSGPAPTLYQLFTPVATPGYRVSCHFTTTGVLQATLFDDLGNNLGMTTYTGVDRQHFGFYISGPCGTFYSDDHRNPGSAAQVLTYAGTVCQGNYGEWWECFEACPYNVGSSTYTGEVLVLESVQPVTPTRSGTWGALKGAYR